ncbi:MAG: M15 family metallopeptidase [Desulfovibrionaceae bacterium]
MKRRNFIKNIAASVTMFPLSLYTSRYAFSQNFVQIAENTPYPSHENIKDYLSKMEHFDKPHPSDVILSESKQTLLLSVTKRLSRLQNTVGHGRFMVLGFDTALKYAKQYSNICQFPKEEIALLEEFFYSDVSQFGFFGEKTLPQITSTIKSSTILKIPHSGNYLYKGKAYQLWLTLQKRMGNTLVLTSGVRGIMKQFHLFLQKTTHSKHNISLASRSIAPPAYSFHSSGDFDIGERGLGANNFTKEFMNTTTYKQLAEEGYLQLRYPHENTLGVRFEPWHVRVL